MQQTTTIKNWQIAVVLLFPLTYFLHQFLPSGIELWVNGNRNYYISFFATTIIFHLSSVILAYMFIKKNNLSIKDIGYNLKLKGTILLFISYFFIAIGIFYFTEWSLQFVKLDIQKVLQLNPVLPRTSQERIFWIFAAFTAGLCEEFVYRGFGISTLILKGINKWVALLITSISFVFIHGTAAITSVQSFTFYLLGGIFFGILFLWKRKLWIPIIIHMLFDLSAVMAIFQASKQ